MDMAAIPFTSLLRERCGNGTGVLTAIHVHWFEVCHLRSCHDMLHEVHVCSGYKCFSFRLRSKASLACYLVIQQPQCLVRRTDSGSGHSSATLNPMPALREPKQPRNSNSHHGSLPTWCHHVFLNLTHPPSLRELCVCGAGEGEERAGLVEICISRLKTYHLLLHCIQFLVPTLASTSTQDMPL